MIYETKKATTKKKLFYVKLIAELLVATMRAKPQLGKYGVVAYGGLRL